MEEEKDAVASTMINSSDDFTTTKYILYGLDLEEQQYVYLLDWHVFVELIPR